jgi:hypothetical protein
MDAGKKCEGYIVSRACKRDGELRELERVTSVEDPRAPPNVIDPPLAFCLSHAGGGRFDI